MLRAGALTDERVVELIRHRYVPVYFDLLPTGAVFDAEGRDFVHRLQRDGHDRSRAAHASTPVLLATPTGEIVARIDNFAPADAFFQVLRQTLDEHPAHDTAGSDERRLRARAESGDGRAVLDVARLERALGRDKRARRLLEQNHESGTPSLRAEISYELGCMDRRQADWQGMERHFRAADERFARAILIERAWAHAARRQWQAARRLLKPLALATTASERRTEALYLLGVASHHLGQRERAAAIWRALIREHAADRWVYRADWALFESSRTQRSATAANGAAATNGNAARTTDAAAHMTRTAPPTSLLGREGYSVKRRHPDLHPE